MARQFSFLRASFLTWSTQLKKVGNQDEKGMMAVRFTGCSLSVWHHCKPWRPGTFHPCSLIPPSFQQCLGKQEVMSPSPWTGVNPSEWYDVRQWWHSHMCGDTTQTTGLYSQNWPTGGTDCMNYNYHESLDTGSLLATYLPICQQVSTHECVYLFLVYFFYTIQLAMVWHGSDS